MPKAQYGDTKRRTDPLEARMALLDYLSKHSSIPFIRAMMIMNKNVRHYKDFLYMMEDEGLIRINREESSAWTLGRISITEKGIYTCKRIKALYELIDKGRQSVLFA